MTQLAKDFRNTHKKVILAIFLQHKTHSRLEKCPSFCLFCPTRDILLSTHICGQAKCPVWTKWTFLKCPPARVYNYTHPLAILL